MNPINSENKIEGDVHKDVGGLKLFKESAVAYGKKSKALSFPNSMGYKPKILLLADPILGKKELTNLNEPGINVDEITLFQEPAINDFYEDRSEYQEIEDYFNSSANTPSNCILYGIGGIGKTQIANKFFNSNRKKSLYGLQARFHCDTFEHLYQDYINFAKHVKLSLNEQNIQLDVIKQIKNHLEKFEDKLLLIYDNVEDYDKIECFLPKTGKSHIIITTRNATNWPFQKRIKVNPMKDYEAINMLTKIVDKEQEDIADLCKELEYIPLAISQAGCYIRNCSITVNRYIKLYKEHASTEHLLTYKEMLGDKIHKSIFYTYDMHFDYLEKECPKAMKLLDLSSFCDPDDVPQDFLQECLGLTENPAEFNKIKEKLNETSLINFYKKFHHGPEVAFIHRTLGLIRRLKLKNKEYFINVLLKTITKSVKYTHDEQDLEQCRMLVSHMIKILEYDKLYVANDNKNKINLIHTNYVIGLYYLDEMYAPCAAEPYFKQAVALLENTQELDNDTKGKIYRQYAKCLSRINRLNKNEKYLRFIKKYRKEAINCFQREEYEYQIYLDIIEGEIFHYDKEIFEKNSKKNIESCSIFIKFPNESIKERAANYLIKIYDRLIKVNDLKKKTKNQELENKKNTLKDLRSEIDDLENKLKELDESMDWSCGAIQKNKTKKSVMKKETKRKKSVIEQLSFDVKILEKDIQNISNEITKNIDFKIKAVNSYLNLSSSKNRWVISILLEILENNNNLSVEDNKKFRSFCYENRDSLPQDKRVQTISSYITIITADAANLLIKREIEQFYYSSDNKRKLQDLLQTTRIKSSEPKPFQTMRKKPEENRRSIRKPIQEADDGDEVQKIYEKPKSPTQSAASLFGNSSVPAKDELNFSNKKRLSNNKKTSAPKRHKEEITEQNISQEDKVDSTDIKANPVETPTFSF